MTLLAHPQCELCAFVGTGRYADLEKLAGYRRDEPAVEKVLPFGWLCARHAEAVRDPLVIRSALRLAEARAA